MELRLLAVVLPPLSGCKRLPDTRAALGKSKEMLKCHRCEQEDKPNRCSEEAYAITEFCVPAFIWLFLTPRLFSPEKNLECNQCGQEDTENIVL